jgi:hypothetical protein
MRYKLNVCELEDVMTVFDAWFSSLVYSFPCINISVRCTFVIQSPKFSYQYPGALHLQDEDVSISIFNRRESQSYNAENRKDLFFNALSQRPFASFFVCFAF